MSRRLLTEKDVMQALKQGNFIEVEKGTIITPLALDKAKQHGIAIRTREESKIKRQEKSHESHDKRIRVCLGSDRAGAEARKHVRKILNDLDYELIELGGYRGEADQIIDVAAKVAMEVARGRCKYGIVIETTGQTACIRANKVRGVRAAMCYDISTAVQCRQELDVNVLTLGAQVVGVATIEHIVRAWLQTKFDQKFSARLRGLEEQG